MTKYDRLGGLDNRQLLPMALEAEKSKVKVPAHLVPSEGARLGW